MLLQELNENPPAAKEIDLKNQERILSMLSFIHQHYPEKINLSQIASAANISNRECLRCFQKNIKKSPFEYLLDYRIEKAVQLLTETNDTVMNIGYQCGFSSHAYFGKKFKEHMGMSPGEFRNKV